MTALVEKHFQKGDATSAALYSPCGHYRYALTRVWDAAAPRLLYVMLNPSTATEQQNDPTIERCERRARTLGYGGFRACNIFAWRETSPALLKKAADPIGPANDAQLAEAARWVGDNGLILCGWGAHADHMGRGKTCAALLRATGRPLAHLGLTKAGEPRHPLYIAYAAQPHRWTVAVD
ncbi:hypothetical protein PSM7751_03162 [Pseudooceanicola marinus]|uniref:DUF1643 domain-containing protein n=1 Tax=Pseudooceanicola marinus TaxID=396013 RepID=A0A1X6ZX73_9RHOB|nr:hypothetical protein CVM50_09705 [Pseudooceanicola marinus]SLN62283.1 hypothetical protein PSM7751_03162 [Pseudooceanicola marinus]